MTRAFTNREDLAGQLVEPGSSDVWEFVPNADKWVGPDYSKFSSYAIVNDRPMVIEGQQTPFPKPKEDLDAATAPTQPIESLERNIPMDRNKFHESLLQQFGGEDPTRINISGKATNIVIGSLQKLWGHVFQDKVPWGGRLTEDQAKFWNKEKSSYYANVYNKILEQNKLDRETMKSALDRFDDEAERIEAAKYKETPAQAEERTKRIEKFKSGLKVPKESATAWQGFFANNPKASDEEIAAFNKQLQKESQPTGTLTENQVAQGLMELATTNVPQGSTVQKEYSKHYNHFRQLVASGLSREDALNEVLKSTDKATPGTEASGKKTYKRLWD